MGWGKENQVLTQLRESLYGREIPPKHSFGGKKIKTVNATI